MVKEGLPFVAIPLVIAVVLAFFGWWISAALFVGLALFMAYFFRDPQRSGLAAFPIDLTGDLGVRLNTMIGVFTLSFASALGRSPF